MFLHLCLHFTHIDKKGREKNNISVSFIPYKFEKEECLSTSNILKTRQLESYLEAEHGREQAHTKPKQNLLKHKVTNQ